jgi:hypothetical protein
MLLSGVPVTKTEIAQVKTSFVERDSVIHLPSKTRTRRKRGEMESREETGEEKEFLKRRKRVGKGCESSTSNVGACGEISVKISE